MPSLLCTDPNKSPLTPPGQATMAGPLDKVPEVDIDDGTFKYILIKVHHSPPAPEPEKSKFIVRG